MKLENSIYIKFTLNVLYRVFGNNVKYLEGEKLKRQKQSYKHCSEIAS